MRPSSLAALCVLACSLTLCGCASAPPTRSATLVFSSPPTPDLTAHAAAVVRLRIDDGGSSRVRSGVMIDPRGYVLTSFSAVGVMGISSARRGGKRPGALFDADHVKVEIFDGPYATVPAEYSARVVRGDLRLNLALLRIDAAPDGALPANHGFASIDLATASNEPLWGGTGFAIGASGSVPGLSVHQASLVAGISNSRGVIAGYLVELLQPTLDGAPYYDGRGRFIGILSHGFLRPPHRIPEAWRQGLAQGALDGREIVGVEPLRPGVWAEIDLLGDGVYVVDYDEEGFSAETEDFFFSLPSLQAGSVIVEPAVGIAAYQRGQLLGNGTGELFLAAETDVLVAVSMPRPEDPRGLRLRVRFEPLQ